jgi:hypothetical protein
MKNNAKMGRPVFLTRDGPGLLRSTTLQVELAKVVAMDTDPASKASVAKDLRAGRGARISEAFEV